MPTECCVPFCNNSGGHAFPRSDESRFKAWKTAVRRGEKDWVPSKHAVVCSEHFDDDDYMPGLTTTGTSRLQKRLKRTAVPHIFPWQKASSSSELERRERARRKVQFDAAQESEIEKRRKLEDKANVSSNVDVYEEIVEATDDHVGGVGAGNSLQETVTVMRDVAVQCQLTQRFSATFFVNDPKGIHFYTGLENYAKFLFVFQTLGQAAYHLNYFHRVSPSLPVIDQFFLTLVKLRQHMPNFAISRTFAISVNSVTNIFVTWINFMSHEWSELTWWPSQDLVYYFTPSDFRAKFPTTRVILDGTEFPIKKPKNPLLQQATFSTYKNKNMAKVVVGGTPGGLISYVSDAYGGSASDRQIIERSGMQQMCEPGDSIMVDKGFNIQDLFVSANVFINIPQFFKNKNRLSISTILKYRKVASKRVHIERLIGLVKTYKILEHRLNKTEIALASEITTACCYLCNFRKCIVPRTA
ncbi:PREDICTED: uncharacterized protein LOC106817220 [Priapulus caudatus]|uniref:Uncharacterized protein LOC106817220 n=1 Tax=Priapulus caudatus TaxID=37621 RepID=A0ABM1EYU7_PRICU|nr:PREDICTED: uncharacterized protein LOC106817220 [Priapulus caudatus]